MLLEAEIIDSVFYVCHRDYIYIFIYIHMIVRNAEIRWTQTLGPRGRGNQGPPLNEIQSDMLSKAWSVASAAVRCFWNFPGEGP